MKEVTDYINGISQDLNAVANNMKQADLQQAGLISKSGLIPSLSDKHQPTSITSNEVMKGADKRNAVVKTVGIDILGGAVAIRAGNPFLGGAMILCGGNSVINGLSDLCNESVGSWGNVGDTNVLQDSMKGYAEKWLPKYIADPAAEVVYLGGAYLSIGGIKGILKSFTDLSKLDAVNTYAKST